MAARPFASLTDFWHRTQVSRPVVERLVLAGGFDSLYRIGPADDGVQPRGRVTRRDLLLQVAELDRHARALHRAARGRGGVGRRPSRTPAAAQARAADAAARNSSEPGEREAAPTVERHPLADGGCGRGRPPSRGPPRPRPR